MKGNRKYSLSIDKLFDIPIAIRKSSSYRTRLGELEKQYGRSFNLEIVDEDVETEEILNRVHDGKYRATIVDNNIFESHRSRYPDLKNVLNILENQPIAWGIRKENQQLLRMVNDYLSSNYGSHKFNVLLVKYFKSSNTIKKHTEFSKKHMNREKISRWDALIKKYARQYNFDWKLIAAMIYEESNFDQNAVSPMGAVGLMQIMPQNAERFGISDIHNPASNIKAGIKLFRWIYNLPSLQRLDADNRLALSLASYNIGMGHVHDAREMARKQGLDRDNWKHVSSILPKLSEYSYYSKTKYGFCRGQNAVDYANNVMYRTSVYRSMADIKSKSLSQILAGE
jgi:membrane-bound lytic murein transglycosylase F